MDQRDAFMLQEQRATLRSHHDGLNDIVSIETATINNEPSETRTEFADQTDIHKILETYMGPQSLAQRQVKYGETIDYSYGLQEALTAVSDAEYAYQETVPPELRKQFPTWREWLNGAHNGSYEHALAELAKRKAEQEPKVPKPEETPKTPEGEKKE